MASIRSSLAGLVLCAVALLMGAGCGRFKVPVQPAKVTPSADHAPGSTVGAATSPAPAKPTATPPPIPILMYHVIASPSPDAAFPGLYVTPATFAAQMAALRTSGYNPLTMQQAYDIWTGKVAAPAHPIVLSFDNGYTSQFTQAVPILRKYGWPGVLNLVVDRLNIPDGLTTDQVRAMIAGGWEVDDQTLTHSDLTLLSAERLQAETVGAAETIRRTFGVPARFFCYPSGHYDPAVISTLHRAGFLGAVTVWPGFADPSVQGALTLDRVRVSYGESAARLLASLHHFATQAPSPPPARYPLPVVPRSPASTAPSSAGPTAAKASGPAATPTATATATPRAGK